MATTSNVFLKLSTKIVDLGITGRLLLLYRIHLVLWILCVVQEQPCARCMVWSGLGRLQVVGYCEYGNELQCSIKCGEFLDRLRNCQLHKNESASLGYEGNYLAVFSHVMDRKESIFLSCVVFDRLANICRNVKVYIKAGQQ